MNEEKLKELINEAADECIKKEGPRYGLTAEEVKECAEQMKDPEYRAKIRIFGKEEFRKRRSEKGEVTE